VVTSRTPASGWLRGDSADQARYQDMHSRFADAPRFGIAIGSTSLIAAWWAGWALVVLVCLASAVMAGGLALHPRSRRPELVGAVTFVLLELDLAASALVSGGGTSPLLPLMVVPVFVQAVCFRPQVIWSFVGLAVLLACAAVGAAGALDLSVETPQWVHLVAYAALLLSLALAATYLASSDRNSRDEAVIDPLTHLLNRTALDVQFPTVRAQAEALGTDVSVVMCDVDWFTTVNDTHGHQRGDRVLEALAATAREAVRSSDTVYRVGGEELLVALPAHDLEAATAVAERLRRAVAEQPLDGLAVTISAGVASARGAEVELADLTSRADTALYAAKDTGRNCVQRARPAGTTPEPARG
jgi:diguanylate cyclase (GGDEF)-like protein